MCVCIQLQQAVGSVEEVRALEERLGDREAVSLCHWLPFVGIFNSNLTSDLFPFLFQELEEAQRQTRDAATRTVSLAV